MAAQAAKEHDGEENRLIIAISTLYNAHCPSHFLSADCIYGRLLMHSGAPKSSSMLLLYHHD